MDAIFLSTSDSALQLCNHSIMTLFQEEFPALLLSTNRFEHIKCTMDVKGTTISIRLKEQKVNNHCLTISTTDVAFEGDCFIDGDTDVSAAIDAVKSSKVARVAKRLPQSMDVVWSYIIDFCIDNIITQEHAKSTHVSSNRDAFPGRKRMRDEATERMEKKNKANPVATRPFISDYHNY